MSPSTELAKKLCPRLRDSPPRPEAESRNLGHTFRSSLYMAFIFLFTVCQPMTYDEDPSSSSYKVAMAWYWLFLTRLTALGYCVIRDCLFHTSCRLLFVTLQQYILVFNEINCIHDFTQPRDHNFMSLCTYLSLA